VPRDANLDEVAAVLASRGLSSAEARCMVKWLGKDCGILLERSAVPVHAG